MAFQLIIAFALVISLQYVYVASTNAQMSQIMTAKMFLETHTNNSMVSEFVLNLYANLAKGMPMNSATGYQHPWKEMQYVDTVRSFSAFDLLEGKNPYLLVFKFNVSTIDWTSPKAERMRAAEMRLALPTGWPRVHQFHVSAATSNDRGLAWSSDATNIAKNSSAGPGRSVVLDATKIVAELIQFVRSHEAAALTTIDIVLRGHLDNNRRKQSKHVTNLRGIEVKSHVQAILIVYTEVGYITNSGLPDALVRKQNRQRRSTDYDDDDEHLRQSNNKNKLQERAVKIVANKSSKLTANNVEPSSSLLPHGLRCRRKDLDVDFMAIGWGEWVVYPTQFNAFQCSGRCSSYADSRSNPTNHAIVQSLVRLVGRQSFPMACCAPTRLSPLSILYMEKGSVVIKHHEDMIVEECGCM